MRTLLVVDVQNDFLPGGSLAVPHGDAVVPVVNRMMPQFELVVATQDWHPPDHLSFASQHAGHAVGETIELNGREQVLWPDHCVQGTPGAGFASALDVAGLDRVFRKGQDRTLDSYSGFFDNDHRRATGLGDFLRQQDARAVWIVGLAADVCVKFTALDAVELGLETHLVSAGTRAVNLQEGDGERALAEMARRGVVLE